MSPVRVAHRRGPSTDGGPSRSTTGESSGSGKERDVAADASRPTTPSAAGEMRPTADQQPSPDPLVYSPRVAGSASNDVGRIGAYLALFSEIGLVLLVTTLTGVLVGYWIDSNLRTLPVFVLIGLFLGLAAGAVAVHRLITRFLARFE